VESEAGYDADLWRRLGSELGVLGLPVPEDCGGAGAGQTERAVLAEELGRALVPAPFLGSAVLAVDTLLALEDDAARKELLPGLASGEQLGAVAVAEPGTRALDPAATATRAFRRDGGWVLDGVKTPVVDGVSADVLLVYAGTDDGPAFFRVEAAADGLTRVPMATMDLSRRMARIEFSGTPATLLDGAAVQALSTVAHQAAVALGAEQVGGLSRALELTVDYATVRVQFGRPIGSYQAVKHGLADVYAEQQLAISALRQASWAADHDIDQLPLAAALLATYVGPAYFRAANAMVQYHGGIGYTWEHDAGRYYRRAKSDELLLGTPAQHRAHLADLLAI